VLATVVAAVQIVAGVEENRHLAAAARRAADVGAVAVGSGPRTAFAANGTQTVLLLAQHADDLTDAGGTAAPADRALADVLAAAEDAAARRIDAVVDDMAAAPTAVDGLDRLTAAALSGSDLDREPVQRAQASAAGAADTAGARSDRLVVVLFLLTLAANAVEIGHSPRLRSWGPHVVATGWGLAGVAVLLTLAVLAPA
jgi:hypothetical protein